MWPLILISLLLSILSEVSYSCKTCSSTKNQQDCESGNSACVWKNSTCKVVASNCSSITNKTLCQQDSINNLNCVYINSTCQDVKSCSTYNLKADCESILGCQFVNSTCSIYTFAYTSTMSSTSTTSCEKQNISWCSNSSIYPSQCYFSTDTGLCKSVSITTQCSKRDQDGCSAFQGCSWNQSAGRCQETTCQSQIYYCSAFFTKFNGDKQLCQKDAAGICQPVTYDKLNSTQCHNLQLYMTWNQTSNKCENCADALAYLYPSLSSSNVDLGNSSNNNSTNKSTGTYYPLRTFSIQLLSTAIMFAFGALLI